MLLIKKILLILIIVGIPNLKTGTCQDYIISGKIIDKETLESLEFANIMILNKEKGTSSDKNGIFQMKIIEEQLEDTLIISFIGYESLKICIKDLPFKPIKLTQKPIELNEVVVKTDKKNKKKIVELNPFKKNKTFIRYAPIYCSSKACKIPILYVPYSPMDQPSIEALFFSFNPKFDKTRYLKKVKLHLFSYKDSALFRLRIFYATKDSTPGNDLLLTPLNYYVDKGEHVINLEIEKYRLQIPKTGVFIGIEKLVISENKYIDETDGFKAIYYSPLLKHVESNEPGYTWQYSSGKWQKESHWYPDQVTDSSGHDVILQNHYYWVTKPAISLFLTE